MHTPDPARRTDPASRERRHPPVRLATRFYLVLAAFLVAVFLSVLLFVSMELSSRIRADAAARLESEARVVRALTAGRPYGDALADSLGVAADLRVTLISRSGTVVGDSEVETRRLPEVENHASRPEVAAALAGRTGVAERASTTVARSLLYVAIPTEQGVLRLSARLPRAGGPAARTRSILVAALLLSLAALYPITRHLARRVERGVSEAEAALEGIARGEPPARPVRPGSGPMAALGFAIDRVAADVRARLEASRQEARDLRALFDGLDEGLAFIDAFGVLGFANPAFERWVGRTAAGGTRIGSLFRSPEILGAVDRAQRGESVTEEVSLGSRTVLMTARPHRGGALLVLRDLTDFRRLEGVRRDFVANVSHELKTPLTSVVGFAEAIAEGGLGDDAAADFGRRILANATRMRRLVDDLLDLALVESGSWSPDFEPVPIGATANEVWTQLIPAPVREGLSLALDDPDRAIVNADADAVRQILRNLLDNAARYAPERSEITVRTRADGAFVRTEVVDRGPGIPSAHVSRVFERFYRVDPGRSREQGGTGLGLAIVKHFVVAHGGEVGIRSEVSRGTAVWFTLPISSESLEDGPEPAPRAARPDEAGPRDEVDYPGEAG